MDAIIILYSNPHKWPKMMKACETRKLGGGFKQFLIFTPYPGEMIQFDEPIFQTEDRFGTKRIHQIGRLKFEC